jgi:hypothetical protein
MPQSLLTGQLKEKPTYRVWCLYSSFVHAEAVQHEREILNAGRLKLHFSERDECKLVLLGLSSAGNLAKPLMSLYGTEWRDCGYGL